MDSVLRDIDRERLKMQTDMAELNRHYEKLRGYVYQHVQQSTMEWARLIVDHPKSLLLIVETTRMVDNDGYAVYRGECEPIRFTALTLATGQIWDQLIYPTHSRAVQGVEYHGLTLADLEGMPVIKEVWPGIANVLEDRHIVVFGADFARDAVRAVYQTRALDGAYCLQNKCKEYYSQFYELSLEKVLHYQGIDKKRDDLKDSRDRIVMLAQIMRNLAAGVAKQEDEVSDDGLDDLSEHPF